MNGRGRPAQVVLSVIVPTYNERDSLPSLLQRLAGVRSVPMEVIIVDDASPDGTGDLADALAREQALPMTVVHRSAKSGLASAVIDGAAVARGEVLTVMDADLSHPPELLPALSGAIAGGAEIAVASRYVPGGGIEGWPLPRRVVSWGATRLARGLLRLRVADPLSGFFAARRQVLTGGTYLGLGYKLLVEILATHPSARVVEIPYKFVDRRYGESKLSFGEIWAFVRLLAHLRGGSVPTWN